MDIWTLIFWCSAIYLIWFYSKRWKIKRQLKAEQKRLEAIELQRQKEIEEKERAERQERERKRELLGIPANAPDGTPIPLEKICTWENGEDGEQILRFTPPFNCEARVITSRSLYSINDAYEYSVEIRIDGWGSSFHNFGIGVAEIVPLSRRPYAPNTIIATFTPGMNAIIRKREEKEAAIEESKRRAKEAEKAAIAAKLKERQRKRDLEKLVAQELIDSGELFGEQAKRPPIPREVVDAVYRRDKGRCVYCGSTENLQLDHIIPFSKGGATTLENLQLLCQKCNLEKSNHIG